jgi:hypothetical protein
MHESAHALASLALLQDSGSALTIAPSVLIARESKQFVKVTIFLTIHRTHSM